MGTQLLLPQMAHPQFSAHICCGQMAAWIKMSLGMKLGLGQGDFVLDEDHAPPPQKGRSLPPQKKIGPCLLRPNGWMDEAGTWQATVLDGDPVPFPQKGAEPPGPQFSAHFYCGQTAACIKMPLGIELGLGQGDFVLDGDPAPFPSPKAAQTPNFRPMLL